MAKINLAKQKKEVFVPASNIKRVGAFILDIFLLQFIVIAPFRRFFESLIPASDDFTGTYQYIASNEAVVNDALSALITISVIMIFYFAYLEYKYGQTVGKIVFHIFVKPKNDDMAIWQCIVRSIFLIPVFPIIILWIIDPVMLFLKGERLSERVSMTRTMEAAA